MSFLLKKYMWLISLVAVVLGAYFLAKMTANFVALQFEGGGSPPSVRISRVDFSGEEGNKKDLEHFNPIIERNIFDSQAVGLIPADDQQGEDIEPLDATGEAVPTSLKIKLISTFSVGAGTDQRSTCIISSGGGQGGEDIYTVNDDEKQFSPDTRVVKILYDRVEFLNKNRLEYVELEDFAKAVSMNVPPTHDEGPIKSTPTDKEENAIEKKSETSFVIDKSEIEEAMANLDKLYTQIRAVPHFKDGKPNGLKLLSVKSGSIFSKLGLTRGDILQKINGVELDIKRGLELFNQLKEETNITIDIERRGSPVSLEYEIR